MFCMPDSIKFKPLESAARAQLNRFIAQYGSAERVEFRRDGVRLSLKLIGVSRPVDAVVRTFRIAPDGSSVELGGYESAVPFVAQALNRQFARKVKVADPIARGVLALAARLLGCA